MYERESSDCHAEGGKLAFSDLLAVGSDHEAAFLAAAEAPFARRLKPVAAAGQSRQRTDTNRSGSEAPRHPAAPYTTVALVTSTVPAPPSQRRPIDVLCSA